MRISFFEIFYYAGTTVLQLKNFFISRSTNIPLNLSYLSILLFTHINKIEKNVCDILIDQKMDML